MTVKSNYNHSKSLFYGLSTDNKPLDADIGSLYIEHDSFLKYYWTGFSWKIIPEIVGSIQYAEIQSGGAYTISKTLRGVATNGNFDIVITSSTKPLHFMIDYASEEKAYFSTYINTIFTEGTPIVPFNRNTSFSIPIGATFKLNPTVTSLGSQRGDDFLGSGGGTGRSGGSGSQSYETVLSPNTNFLVRLTNASSQAKDLNIIINMYEL